MVNVVYHKMYNRLTVQGHACSGEKGYDLICAAASILVWTLAENVKHMEEARIVRDAAIRVEEGDAEIGCTASTSYRNVVMQTYQSVIVGFEILASKFPQNISFEIMV